MLGRRQIREKVMKELYASQIASVNDKNKVLGDLLKGIDQIEPLYFILLDLIRAIGDRAEELIEIGKKKHLATEKELNPSYRFVSNKVLKILQENKVLNTFVEKHGEYSWSKEKGFAATIFKRFCESEKFKAYIETEGEQRFNQDKKLILSLFKDFIADNDDILDYLEEININWQDDMHIANSMVVATLESLVPSCGEFTELYKVYKNQEDERFTQKLFETTFDHKQEFVEKIGKMSENWDVSRVAPIDLVILQMALSEFHYFPSVPNRVVINEYVELAKAYSTDKSQVYVNGILDRYLKENL